MARPKKTKARIRIARAMQRARRIIQEIVAGAEDPYVGYRQLYGIFVRNSGVHDELREFFRVPGVEPDGMLQVDDEFREVVRQMAADWLARHPE